MITLGTSKPLVYIYETNNARSAQRCGASGAFHLDTGTLQKIKVGTYEIRDVPVSVANLPKELKAHCVLGMNVLREFLITIDSIDRTISLTHRPYPKKYRLENYSVSMLADVADDDSQKE